MRVFSAPVRPSPRRPGRRRPTAPASTRWPSRRCAGLDAAGGPVLPAGAGLRHADLPGRRPTRARSSPAPTASRSSPSPRPLIAEHRIAPSEAGTLHAWLAAHRGPEADAVMEEDPRYVFFRLETDDGGEPRGAAGAPLIAGRSVAVDPAAHPYGELLWIDAEDPSLARRAAGLPAAGRGAGHRRRDQGRGARRPLPRPRASRRRGGRAGAPRRCGSTASSR